MANALLFRPLSFTATAFPSTAAGYDVSNLNPVPVPRMGRVWRSDSGITQAAILIDLGSDQPLDTIALFGIGDGNGAPSSSWIWSVELATNAQGPFTGAFWQGAGVSVLAGSELPMSGRGKALWLAPADAPSAARYVRLAFAGLSGAQLQIAVVAIGQRFQPQRNYSYGAAFGVRDLGRLDYSPRGVVLRRPGAKLRGMGLTFTAVRRDELEDTLQRLFERIGNTDPVVLVSDPDPHPQRQNRMGIGHLTGNLGSIHRQPGAFQAEVNFVAVD